MMEELLSMKCRNCSSSYATNIRDIRHVPLVLWCGCTFCMGCLSKLSRSGYIKCPHCRKKTVVSLDVDLKEQLAPNYYLLGRIAAKNLKLPRFPVTTCKPLAMLSTSTSVPAVSLDLDVGVAHPDVQVRCEECLALGSVECQQCSGVYCDNCYQTIHMSSNSMRRHVAIPLSQLQSGPSHCPTHQTLLLDYFCTDDAVCVCSQCCITGDHKGHQVLPLKETTESQREKLVPLITEAKNGIKVLQTASESIDDGLIACKKEVRLELSRLERHFSKAYTLLQLHQQSVTERLCSAVVDSITPLKNMQTEVHAQMHSVVHKVKIGEEALKDDYVLMRESFSLINALSSGVQLPLKLQLNDIALPKVTLDLVPFKHYLADSFGTITANTDTNKSELDGNNVSVVVSGIASPAHPVTTPTSSRPPSALSECYLSSALVGSERGSRASSYRSISPSSSPRKPQLPVDKVKIEDTIEVWVCHVVGIGEFYIQSHDQRLAVEQMSQSLSSLSPSPLCLDNLVEGTQCVGVSLSDEVWYRAVVTSVHLTPPVHATVKFVDCGRMEDLPLTRLYEVPHGLWEGTSSQCVQCHLHAIHPPKIRYQHHVTPTLWSPNANNIFSQLVSGKAFRIKVYRQKSFGVLSVDLLLFDGQGGEISRGARGGGEISRGSGSEGEINECTSVISQLIERGVAVLNSRKWAEPLSQPVNLGAGDCMDVTVPTAENPWDFYVHLVAGEKDRQKISDMLSHQTGRLAQISLTPYKNMLCCSQFSEDNTMYRGRVKELHSDGDVLIEFVDFGNSEIVVRKDLFELPGDLLTTPIQALHCRLPSVQPAESQAIWSEQVSDQFNELVSEPLYNMVVKEMGTPLSVELINKETGQSLSDLLVELKMADYSLKKSPLQPRSPVNGIQLSSLVQPGSILLHSEQPSIHLDTTGSQHDAVIVPPSLPSHVPPVLATIPPAQPPAVGETITAKVVHICSPNHFYIQRIDASLLHQLNQLKTVKAKKLKNIEPGAACLARFHGDKGYHRVTVLSVRSNKVKVCYVDFGNCMELCEDEVYPLPHELATQPALAIPCSLVGGAREFPHNMLPLFSELVVDKTLSVTVKGVDIGPPTVLLVSLQDEQGEDVEEKLLSRVQPPDDSSGEKEGESGAYVNGGEATSSDEATLNHTSVPPEHRQLSVCVTYVSPSGIVYGHDVSPGSSTADKLRVIDKAVERRCRAPSPIPPGHALHLECGQSLCAKSEDGIWYRATVKRIEDKSITVYYSDYGNCEIVAKNDIIPEAVCSDLSPQAVGLEFPSLHESLLKQMAPIDNQQVNVISEAILDEEQLTSLSQLLIDKQITVATRGGDNRGHLIASCDVIDAFAKSL